MAIDSVKNQVQIKDVQAGKPAVGFDVQRNTSIFRANKAETNKHFELMDPDEFVDFLLKNDPTINFDELGEEEKAEKRREKKLEIIIKMNPELANTKLDEKAQNMLIADHDITIRAARYAMATGMINDIRELSDLSDEEISYVKYKALEKHIEINPDKKLNFAEKMILNRGDLLKSIAQANNMEELDLYNADNKYEMMYKYLSDKEKKKGLSRYEEGEFMPLKDLFKKYDGDFKNIEMAQWGKGKFFEDIDDDGVLKKTINRVKGNTLFAKLEKELKDLSPEEQQEKITWLLKDCASIDQYCRMSKDLGILQKKGLVDANALVNAQNGYIQAFASFASKEMDAKGQEMVGKEFARQAKMENSPITDKQVHGYMTNIIPEYEVEAQAPAAKAMIDTKRDAAINAAGEMISLLADDPAKSVYEWVVDPNSNSGLTQEQRGIITNSAHYYCSQEGYEHPDRLAQFTQIDTDYNYNYSTGGYNEQNYSEFSPFNNTYSTQNDNLFSANGTVTNPINRPDNQSFLDYVLGSEKDEQEIKEIVAKIQNSSSPQEIREALKGMPEYAFTDMVQANPELLNKFLGTEFEDKAKKALLAISYIPEVNNILNELENKENK